MHNTAAVWSPDGTELVFTGRPDGVRNLHLRPVDGSKPDEPLLARGPDRTPDDWSTDGRHILYEEGGQAGRDLWTLRMPEREPARSSRPSSMSGQGGSHPTVGGWPTRPMRLDAARCMSGLFQMRRGRSRYQSVAARHRSGHRAATSSFSSMPDKAVHAVSVRTGETFEYGVPEVLFTPNIRSPGLRKWTTDGQRFLIVPNPPGPVCQWQPKTAHLWQPKTAHFWGGRLGRSGHSPGDARRACWAGRRERSDRSPGQHAPGSCGAGGHVATPSRCSSDAVLSQC